jgi:CSLREA domain-containing protein
MKEESRVPCWLIPRALLASLVLVSFVVAALAVASVAGAATFVVASTTDAVDVAPGDGVCADSLGVCTLRAAVQEANAFPGADTISLPAGTYMLSLAGTNEDLAASGDLDVRSPLALVGAGAAVTTIDAVGIDRVLDVHPGAGQVRLEGVTVTGGRWQRSPAPIVDARVEGAGILNSASLSIVGSVVSGNVAAGLTDAEGGGIYDDATGVLALTGSTVSGNTSGVIGGGISNHGSAEITTTSITGNDARSDGGGLLNAGTMHIHQSRIESNSSLMLGGGISNRGELSLADSSVTSNVAGVTGAGLASAGGTVAIERSTLAANRTTSAVPGVVGGAAVFVTGGTLSLVNGTLSGNSTGGVGGAIWAQGGGVTVAFTTIADNSGGGLRLETSATASFRGTILARNTNAAGGAANCDGPVKPASLGHNLEDAATCALGGSGDLSSTDPMLTPLADNGGPTLTRGLLPGSPAIDAAADPACPATDQRGVSRPQGPACDIGAYEVVRTAPCLTGVQTGPLTVSPGETVCIGAGGVQSGPIRVNPGGSLEVKGGTITGPVTASGAAGIRLCGATLTGRLTISGSTGLVVVGGDAATGPCDGNTITGPVRLTGNTAGVEFNGNTVTGPVQITGNTGSLPSPDTGAVHAVGNYVVGPVTIQP